MLGVVSDASRSETGRPGCDHAVTMSSATTGHAGELLGTLVRGYGIRFRLG